jgi:Holliday junction DNA helicase RuvA
MVRGILIEKGPESIVVEAGGLGYELSLTQPALQALPALGEEVRLFTHHHVREDEQRLYGFLSAADRQVFLLLMTVKGVGPKLAMGILSNLSGPALAGALLKRDLVALSAIPGVGKKLAERLGVELSDKVKTLGLDLGPSALTAASTASFSGAWAQALSALLALGFGQNQARQALEKAHQGLGNDPVSTEDIVKAALKGL